MASRRWPPTAGAGGAVAVDRVDSHGLRGLGAEAGRDLGGLDSRRWTARVAGDVSGSGGGRRRRRCSGRVRGRVAGGSAQAGLTRLAMGPPVFACRTTTASPQARLARPFSGDGTLSVANGAIKASQNKAHGHTFQSPQYLYVETDGSGSFLGLPRRVRLCFSDIRPSKGPEAHPSFISGCFVIKAFGAVSRPGSVDAAQLASRLAVLEAALQTDIDFKLLYPGGSATTPGSSIRTPHRR